MTMTKLFIALVVIILSTIVVVLATPTKLPQSSQYANIKPSVAAGYRRKLVENLVGVYIGDKNDHIALRLPTYFTPSHTPSLVTFQASSTLGYMLQSAMFSHTQNCKFIHVQTQQPLNNDIVFSELISELQNIQVLCDNAQHQLMFEQVSVPPHRQAPFDLSLLRDSEFIEQSRRYVKQKKDQPREYPFEASDIVADGILQALAWGVTWLENHWGAIHPFNTYQDTNLTGIYHLDTGVALQATQQIPAGFKRQSGSEIRIGLSADWGAGTRESDYVVQLMTNDFNPHYNIHLGDVYLLGTIDEVKSNALGIVPPNVEKAVKWPLGSIGTFALNGNHETYSRCYGFFDYLLPSIGMNDATTGQPQGQQASYFMLENEYWRVIALDTGYHTYSILFDDRNNTQPDPVIDWLINTVKLNDPSDTRGIILLSHHEYRSAFDNPYLATPSQLAAIIPQGRQVLWLWGHEHRLAFYNLSTYGGVDLNAYARCVGTGGFPVSLAAVPSDARASGLYVYDDRLYETITGLYNFTAGYNGYSQIVLRDNEIDINYYSLELDQNGIVSNKTATPLVKETFTANLDNGNVELSSFTILNPNLTVVEHL